MGIGGDRERGKEMGQNLTKEGVGNIRSGGEVTSNKLQVL